MFTKKFGDFRSKATFNSDGGAEPAAPQSAIDTAAIYEEMALLKLAAKRETEPAKVERDVAGQ